MKHVIVKIKIKNKYNTNNYDIISDKRFVKSFLIVLANFSIEFIITRRYYGNEVEAADGLMGLL